MNDERYLNGVDSAELRRVFGAFPSGVTAVAALVNDRPVGIAVSSFTSVSLAPPLVSVCIARTSTTWPTLRLAARFGVSVFSGDQEVECRALSERRQDRFSGLAWRATADGAVLLEGVSAWLVCSIERQVQAGDHDIVVLHVHDLDASPNLKPLIFYASNLQRLGQ
jgi:flavin reductase (DIM6/NTAB) family NADH-FMN oxidoreductase RutF